MAQSTVAGVITAIGTLATAIALIITACAGLIAARRVSRKVDGVQQTSDENHKMLNQDRTDRMNYQRALIRALQARGIEVPVDQSATGEEGSPASPGTSSSL